MQALARVNQILISKLVVAGNDSGWPRFKRKMAPDCLNERFSFKFLQVGD